MKVLAIDSATEACSVALQVDGQVIWRHSVAPRRHAELLLPYMEEVLAEAGLTLQQLDCLAFGRGPGAFTGVRIATGVVQGVAYAVDLPVVAVSTLAAMAQGCHREAGGERVIAAIDARMGEVYWGSYGLDGDGLMQPVGVECVARPEHLPGVEGEGWHGVGTGWQSYASQLASHYGPQVTRMDGERLPHAIDIAGLGRQGFLQGRAVSAEQALPVYLRDQVAEKAKSV